MTIKYVTLRGTNESGSLSEIFIHGFHVDTDKTLDQLCQVVSTEWKVAWGSATGIYIHFSPGVQYTEVTAANLMDNSPRKLSAAHHLSLAPIQPGAGTDPPMPAQCAIAVSLKGGTYANGVPMKGRFYLPTPSHDILGADGLVIGSIVDYISSAMAGFVTRLNDQGAYVVLVSAKEEFNTPVVEEVRVGNKIDTQRRRRNKLPETYTPFIIAGPQ